MRTTEHLGLFVPEGDDFYFGEDGPEQDNPDIIDAAMKNHEERVLTLEGKTDSFFADFEAYYGNTKLIDDFQNVDGRTFGSEDTVNVKIGSKSLKIEEINNISGSIVSDYNNLPTFNLGTFNNGLPSSIDDYVVLIAYVSDATMVTNLGFGLSPEPTYNASNNANKTISSGIVTGRNCFKIKKSEIAGVTGINSDMKSIRMFWTSISNAQGAYVSFQLLQLVKKDPEADFPNPYQLNGVRKYIPNTGEWFLWKEFGKIISRELSNKEVNLDGLKSVNTFKDFTIYVKKVVNGSYDYYNSWWKDADNRISFDLSASNLRLTYANNGSVTSISKPTGISVVKGDVVEYILEKYGSGLHLTAFINGDYDNPISIPATQDFGETQGSLTFGLSTSTATTANILAASITEISHVHHSNIAETAKGLTEQLNDTLIGGTQSIPNDVDTKVIWLSSSNGNKYSTFDSNDPTKVFLRQKGKYILVFKVAFAYNPTGLRFCQFKKNGSIIEGIDSKNAVETSPALTYFTTAITVESNGNDYYEIIVGQKSGAALDISNIPNRSVRLNIYKIG